jgi:hypothetical protein
MTISINILLCDLNSFLSNPSRWQILLQILLSLVLQTESEILKWFPQS